VLGVIPAKGFTINDLVDNCSALSILLFPLLLLAAAVTLTSRINPNAC
jgi:hypothetical protein